jgi:glutamate:GABA antiporter
MGWRDLVLFYVVTSLNVQFVQQSAAAGPSALVIWIGACLLFYVPLVLAVLELSSRYPEQGGIYVWTRRSFGRFAGFMTGWSYWFCNIPYYPFLLYFVASLIPYLLGPGAQHLTSDPRYMIGVSLTGLTLCVVLNLVGLNIGKWLHNVGAIGIWLPTGILLGVAAVAWHRLGSATVFTPQSFTPSTRLTDIKLWGLIAFAYAGVESASIMGGEIDQSKRTVPRALFTAGAIITLVYLAATTAVLVTLPLGAVTTLQGVPDAIQAATLRVGAGWVAPIAIGCLVIGILGQLGGWFAASARLPYAAAVDGVLPAALGRLHPTWRTPYVAMLIQGGFAVLITIAGQAGSTVKNAYLYFLDASVITYFFPYLYLFASLIRVQREPAGEHVMRVPGGRPVAILCGMVGFTTTAIAIALAAVPAADDPNKPLAVAKVVGFSALVMAVGALIYGCMEWPSARSTSASNAAEQFSRLE